MNNSYPDSVPGPARAIGSCGPEAQTIRLQGIDASGPVNGATVGKRIGPGDIVRINGQDVRISALERVNENVMRLVWVETKHLDVPLNPLPGQPEWRWLWLAPRHWEMLGPVPASARQGSQ